MVAQINFSSLQAKPISKTFAINSQTSKDVQLDRILVALCRDAGCVNADGSVYRMASLTIEQAEIAKNKGWGDYAKFQDRLCGYSGGCVDYVDTRNWAKDLYARGVRVDENGKVTR